MYFCSFRQFQAVAAAFATAVDVTAAEAMWEQSTNVSQGFAVQTRVEKEIQLLISPTEEKSCWGLSKFCWTSCLLLAVFHRFT